MKKQSPLERAAERTAATLHAARELAETAFECPSEETVMRLFADMARHREEVEAEHEVATIRDEPDEDEWPAPVEGLRTVH